MQPTGGTNKNKTEQLKGMRIFHSGRYEITGTTSEAITIDGVQATDLAFVIKAETSAVYVLCVETSANTVTVGFSGDSQGEDVNILIMRP